MKNHQEEKQIEELSPSAQIQEEKENFDEREYISNLNKLEEEHIKAVQQEQIQEFELEMERLYMEREDKLSM